MRAGADRKNVIRIAVLAASVAGLAFTAFTLAGFVGSVAHNGLAGGPMLTRFAEYYRQVGAYYARGFTTGFFACYFLMLCAIIVGSWVDELRTARRKAKEPSPAPIAPAVLVGEPAIEK
jgi:hypothetical protein